LVVDHLEVKGPSRNPKFDRIELSLGHLPNFAAVVVQEPLQRVPIDGSANEGQRLEGRVKYEGRGMVSFPLGHGRRELRRIRTTHEPRLLSRHRKRWNQ